MAKNVKVILRKEVSTLGQPGDTVEVKAGYARNFLIPQGEAMLWTERAGRQIEQMQRARRAQALKTREDAVAAKTAIEGTTVEIAARVSESGKLFGGISAESVAKALAAQVAEAGSVEARNITVEAIKTTGTYPVTVKLHPEISAQFTVKVVAE
ncbi:50S ribosomal protein L9 [Scardovia inopinata]|uniref:Large ribosomal subunit protein bL9 n=1 Tax=Scardovia inopinata F0304 TaxID=641146 RepID=W5IH42_SCAIO|nr:50S ribosomal protein L9 [Scardovia inopinata]EFG26145.1 ribosomal protein L9 [Scardovia inopinata F0304]BAR07228.1 50S ribosomal protein L9 [Scardovia inopinata JCM 12537]SUV51297.1 50S ribosomal protein L9 [Scardovia inopinata]